MSVSFNVVRRIGVSIIILLLIVFSGLYLFSVDENINSLNMVIANYLPILDKLLIVSNYSHESKRLFDLYVSQDKLFVVDIMSTLEQFITKIEYLKKIVVPKDQVIGDLIEETQLINELNRLKLAIYAYESEEKLNARGTSAFEMQRVVLNIKQEIAKIMREIVNQKDQASVATREEIDLVADLFRETKNIIERYCSQKIIHKQEILEVIDKFDKECSSLRPMLTEEAVILVDSILHNVGMFKIAVEQYLDNESQDPDSASTKEMQAAAKRIGIDINKTAQKLMQNLREQILSSQLIAIRRAKRLQKMVLLGFFGSTLVSLLIALWTSRVLTNRIKKLVEGTEQFAKGIWSHSIDISSKDQFGHLADSFNKMIEKLHETTVSKEYLDNIINTMTDALIVMSLEGEIRDVNSAVCTLLGYSKEELIGNSLGVFVEDLNWFQKNREKFNKEVIFYTKDKQTVHVLCSSMHMRTEGGIDDLVIFMGKDISERIKMEEEKKHLQQELIQSQKMESIGILASGIAHEINTPIQFISHNNKFIAENINGMFELIAKYQKNIQKLEPVEIKEIQEKEKKLDLHFLKQEIPSAIKDTEEGIVRVATIIKAMKSYAHTDSQHKIEDNINAAIESTIVITRNHWKAVADIEKLLDDSLPLVPCFIADIKQVILNLIIKAVHAINDVFLETKNKGIITISTKKKNDDMVIISISDTGTGIPKEIRDKVFDQFFTTKEVGVGTGQGLSLVYNIIVEKHNGKVYFDSEVGKGTIFYIELPLKCS